MKARIMNATAVAALLLAPIASQAAEQSKQALYCTGQTRILLGQNAINETHAYLEVGATSTYIEINGVGFGSSPGKPKMLSATGANMPFTLKPAYEGGPELKAQISLNIYSGSLSVLYFDHENKMRSAFEGDCKKADPLIKF